ncbi:MAG: FtsW/RodA/SpoVE family cell cycle protein [Anaerolineae bacterium]|nr:FtsW/RodA/SpoVE family cell cycle protein [Anaerolineae bacterium]
MAASALLLLLATLFVIGGAIMLALTPYPVSLRPVHLIALVGGWGIAWIGSFWLLRTRLSDFDNLLLSVVALLTGWGLILQARLAPAMIIRQIVWLLLGCSLLCAVALTPELIRWLRRYRYTLLTVGILFLAATLVLGVNPSGYGQELWLGAFGLYVQPSEPLKLLLVIYLAAYLSEKRDLSAIRADDASTDAPNHLWPLILGPMLVMVGVALLLLAWQQDLGAALLYYLTFVTMLSLAWGKPRYAVLSLVLFIPVAIAGYVLSSRVALRVSIWLDPWAPEQADRAFQILQSLFAFSAGGLGGQGLSQGFPGVIPAVHTDFVYAALVEEFGVAGGLVLLALFAIYVTRGIQLAQRSESSFESLLAGGIAAQVCVQTWIITAGNAKLIPITGVTLPFLSYGGSSLVTMLVATGLLINLSTAHRSPLALSLGPSAARPLRKSAAALGQVLMLLLGSVALVTGVWSIVRADDLQQYPTNPRYVLSEARIQRGKILDRRETVLAGIEVDDDGYVTRTYPVAEAAAVVGYATLEYGTSGIEAACDARLRGEIDRSAWHSVRDELLHVDPVGRDVRVTIDARLQAAAQAKLAGQVGAAVLVDAHTGEILALASAPTFSTATIGEVWEELRDAPESPLLNRATQGLAQPGTSLQPFILAAGWQAGTATAPVEPITNSVPFDGMAVNCRHMPQESTWSSVLSSGCPYPFVQVAEELGSAQFVESMQRWGFLNAPDLALPSVAADLEEMALDLQEEALGQGQLLLTPLQMVEAMATLGNDGLRPDLHILAQPTAGCTEPRADPAEGQRVVDDDVAERIRAALTPYGGSVGHVGTAVAGPEREQAWFAGLNSASLPRYAVAVLLDRPETSQAAADIGTELLRLVIELQ